MFQFHSIWTWFEGGCAHSTSSIVTSFHPQPQPDDSAGKHCVHACKCIFSIFMQNFIWIGMYDLCENYNSGGNNGSVCFSFSLSLLLCARVSMGSHHRTGWTGCCVCEGQHGFPPHHRTGWSGCCVHGGPHDPCLPTHRRWIANINSTHSVHILSCHDVTVATSQILAGVRMGWDGYRDHACNWGLPQCLLGAAG